MYPFFFIYLLIVISYTCGIVLKSYQLYAKKADFPHSAHVLFFKDVLGTCGYVCHVSKDTRVVSMCLTHINSLNGRLPHIVGDMVPRNSPFFLLLHAFRYVKYGSEFDYIISIQIVRLTQCSLCILFSCS